MERICLPQQLRQLKITGRNIQQQNEQAQLDYMLGQAMFNRALAYWHGQIFFELKPDGWGFPIFDKVATDLEGMKRAPATVPDCLGLCD